MSGWPSARQWLFSLKAFLAAMLALYIALWMDLPRPYWAMATVYFVSHPLTGATRSKAAYRVLGTLLGASAAVVTVPLLVNGPVLLMAAVSLWTALLLYLSLLQRTPRSYVFLLAAYTLPIVALPAVGQPEQIFDIAVARIEEIVIGIVCAGVVGSVVFPANVASALGARAAAWLADAALWAGDMLSADAEASVLRHGSRHRLAADILALDQLIAQLSYDAENAQVLRMAAALRERMTLLLPVLSSLAGVMQDLRRHPEGIPAPLADAMARLRAWCRAGFAGPAPRLDGDLEGSGQAPAAAGADEAGADEAGAGDGTAGDAAAGDATDTLAGHRRWHASLVAAAADHLRTLAALCEDCRTLQRRLAGRRTGLRGLRGPRLRHRGELVVRAHHHDHGMLLWYAGSTGLAVFCAGLLWIASGWEDGGGAVAVAAIACCFFATIEEPRPVARTFVRWSAMCLAVSCFYLFLVVPTTHDFETLAALLALPYLGIGVLIQRPGFNLIAMLLSVNTASLANFHSVYDVNFLGIFNTMLASVGAMLFAPFWSMVTRPFGARVAAHRLIRAGWKDLADAAVTRVAGAGAGPGALGGRMLDRLSQLVPRLAASDASLSSDGFAELQAGFSALALHRSLPALPPAARAAVAGVLDGMAAHFRGRLHAAHIPAPSTLSLGIDAALAQLAAPPNRAAREARAALVVLQVTLYPTCHDMPGRAS